MQPSRPTPGNGCFFKVAKLLNIVKLLHMLKEAQIWRLDKDHACISISYSNLIGFLHTTSSILSLFSIPTLNKPLWFRFSSAFRVESLLFSAYCILYYNSIRRSSFYPRLLWYPTKRATTTYYCGWPRLYHVCAAKVSPWALICCEK